MGYQDLYNENNLNKQQEVKNEMKRELFTLRQHQLQLTMEFYWRKIIKLYELKI